MRTLKTLQIRTMQHLCHHLGTNTRELLYICKHPERFYEEGPRKIKGKIRDIATPIGRLRLILDRVQRLLQRIELDNSIHGGRRGRSYLTNALPHIGKPAIIELDIRDFFPKVTDRRVYEVFTRRLGCTSEVARYLTSLTTLHGALPQGSPTSTILASIVIEPLTERLAGLARAHNGDYSQYVDDITISGPKHIAQLCPLVEKIVKNEGFAVNVSKTKIRYQSDEQIVTGVRVNKGIDVPSEKIKEAKELLQQLKHQVQSGVKPSRPALLSLQGKINHIGTLNRGAGSHLRRQMRSIET